MSAPQGYHLLYRKSESVQPRFFCALSSCEVSRHRSFALSEPQENHGRVGDIELHRRLNACVATVLPKNKNENPLPITYSTEQNSGTNVGGSAASIVPAWLDGFRTASAQKNPATLRAPKMCDQAARTAIVRSDAPCRKAVAHIRACAGAS